MHLSSSLVKLALTEACIVSQHTSICVLKGLGFRLFTLLLLRMCCLHSIVNAYSALPSGVAAGPAPAQTTAAPPAVGAQLAVATLTGAAPPQAISNTPLPVPKAAGSAEPTTFTARPLTAGCVAPSAAAEATAASTAMPAPSLIDPATTAASAPSPVATTPARVVTRTPALPRKTQMALPEATAPPAPPTKRQKVKTIKAHHFRSCRGLLQVHRVPMRRGYETRMLIRMVSYLFPGSLAQLITSFAVFLRPVRALVAFNALI